MIPISPPVTPKTFYNEKYDDHHHESYDPILITDLKIITKRSRVKSIPRRSPSPSTRHCFTMNLSDLYSKKKPQPKQTKKSKSDTAALYDALDITQPDKEFFQDDPQWIPNMDAFAQYPHVKAVWKGTPLDISHMPYYELLHPGEVEIASILRLTPEQYLRCRRALIVGAQQFDKLQMTFRKSDAQKCVRIDVNKTSTLWTVFSRLGWFNPRQH
ncbi:hypothetical protein G6F70_006966 [Rhizopus microsporus]|uniref:SWIRM domain-containing protein n=1 Tax=Rhizopus microsporus TaxID=58291 RepID=A0A0A1NUX3_RHIZD|nr:hypothetical protein G6F71_000763 [Rhizopus microsporus]KAG1197032.1 hypothetical protein G6F70_006966 [Rhizopus microsporus]KAG1208918.1 hypothetical protein G6F69_006813 [Rhizopus microsporus]KAG1230307.1 hypothetical protein G6F67_006556 [Rhizopus microsporus]KAG1259547.1 hypothetical protein G6F68_008035 [Rhizopus microsporus]